MNAIPTIEIKTTRFGNPDEATIEFADPDEVTVVEIDPLMMIGAALLAQAGVIDLSEAREIVGLPAMTGRQKRLLAAMAKYVKLTGVPFDVVWSEFWPRGG